MKKTPLMAFLCWLFVFITPRLFGDSKSSTANTTNTTNVGFSEIGGPVAYGTGNTITVTDGGAVNQAIAHATNTQQEFTRAVSAISQESRKSETDRLIELGKWGLGVAAVVMLAKATMGRKKNK